MIYAVAMASGGITDIPGFMKVDITNGRDI
jgi:hypothetical protein